MLKIDSKLSWWSRYAKAMSFQGRVIVLNQLAATKLFHRLVSLSPPPDVIDKIKQSFLDFFWQGRHWLPAQLVYAPVKIGGQNLVNLTTRITAFRLQYFQRFLYSDIDHPAFAFTNYYFKRAHNLDYGPQLLAINLHSVPEIFPSAFVSLYSVQGMYVVSFDVVPGM